MTMSSIRHSISVCVWLISCQQEEEPLDFILQVIAQEVWQPPSDPVPVPLQGTVPCCSFRELCRIVSAENWAVLFLQRTQLTTPLNCQIRVRLCVYASVFVGSVRSRCKYRLVWRPCATAPADDSLPNCPRLYSRYRANIFSASSTTRTRSTTASTPSSTPSTTTAAVRASCVPTIRPAERSAAVKPTS